MNNIVLLNKHTFTMVRFKSGKAVVLDSGHDEFFNTLNTVGVDGIVTGERIVECNHDKSMDGGTWCLNFRRFHLFVSEIESFIEVTAQDMRDGAVP